MQTKTLEDLSSVEERGNRLRILRNMTGLTINELSERYNIGTSTIKYWETAKQEGLSVKGAKKIIDSLVKEGIHCSFTWLMHGLGIGPQYIYSGFGEDKENLNLLQVALEDEQVIYKEVDLFLKESYNAITLVVYDNSMEPFYRFGDTVGGIRLYGENIDLALGKNCIVETEKHNVLCRRLEQGNGKNKYTLASVNSRTTATPPNLFDIEIKSVAPVSRCWLRSTLINKFDK